MCPLFFLLPDAADPGNLPCCRPFLNVCPGLFHSCRQPAYRLQSQCPRLSSGSCQGCLVLHISHKLYFHQLLESQRMNKHLQIERASDFLKWPFGEWSFFLNAFHIARTLCFLKDKFNIPFTQETLKHFVRVRSNLRTG